MWKSRDHDEMNHYIETDEDSYWLCFEYWTNDPNLLSSDQREEKFYSVNYSASLRVGDITIDSFK